MSLALILLAFAQAPIDSRPVMVEIRLTEFDIFKHPKIVERFEKSQGDPAKQAELFAEVQRVDKPIEEFEVSVPVTPLTPTAVKCKASLTYSIPIELKRLADGDCVVAVRIERSKTTDDGIERIATEIDVALVPNAPRSFIFCGGVRIMRNSKDPSEAKDLVLFVEMSVKEIKEDVK